MVNDTTTVNALDWATQSTNGYAAGAPAAWYGYGYDGAGQQRLVVTPISPTLALPITTTLDAEGLARYHGEGIC